MKPTLYFATNACSLAPLIALLETGADFVPQRIDMANNEQRGERYLRLNPKGRVPLLTVDDWVLTENVAIQSWIADTFPASKLLPSGPQRYEALSLLAWCASGLHPPITRTGRPARFLSNPDGHADLKAAALAEQEANFALIEERLPASGWLFGDFGCADAYLFWVWRRSRQVMALPAFAKYDAHAAAVQQRPSVQRALALESGSGH